MAYRKHVNRDRCAALDETILETAVHYVALDRKHESMDLKHIPNDETKNDYRALRRMVEVQLATVGPDKTPGYPFNLEFATNYSVVQEAREELIGVAVARLHMWLDERVPFQEFSRQRLGLVMNGLVDPSSVFVKTEPHPSRKAKDGRYRCINPVSLPDQLVEGVLFSESAENLKKRLYANGSAIGIGFSDDQIAEFNGAVQKLTKALGPFTSDDMGGFDAVHTEQSLMATTRIDAKSHTYKGGPLPKCWMMANERWVYACCYSVAVIGMFLYEKLSPGMLNSGSKDTSRRNTLLRCMYSYYFALYSGQTPKFAMANGDDGLLWGLTDVDAYLAAASENGFRIRDCEMSSVNEDFEFCSHLYKGGNKAELVSWPKGLYSILSKKGTFLSDAMQFVNETRHNEEYERLLALVRDLDLPEIRAPEYLDKTDN